MCRVSLLFLTNQVEESNNRRGVMENLERIHGSIDIQNNDDLFNLILEHREMLIEIVDYINRKGMA